MIQTRAPIITEGQLYLNEPLNEYLVVTKNNGGQIAYCGVGFKGNLEDQAFIERFQPVDPNEIEPHEAKQLLDLSRPGTKLKTGFIAT